MFEMREREKERMRGEGGKKKSRDLPVAVREGAK
jgi:hypothetical protein